MTICLGWAKGKNGAPWLGGRSRRLRDPGPYLREDGTPNPVWEYDVLTEAHLAPPLPLEECQRRALARNRIPKGIRVTSELDERTGKVVEAEVPRRYGRDRG